MVLVRAVVQCSRIDRDREIHSLIQRRVIIMTSLEMSKEIDTVSLAKRLRQKTEIWNGTLYEKKKKKKKKKKKEENRQSG